MSQDIQCTVVTIARNHLTGLEATLNSVNRQTGNRIESVVIDGASTDGSAALLASWRSRHEFRFISEPDAGIYDAMNKGISLASGELIIYMNAGDRFSSEDVIARVLADRASNPWRWGYGCGRALGANGDPVAVYSFVPFRQDRLALGTATIPHQATFMERELLLELNGFNLGVGLSADQELMARAAVLSAPRQWADFFVDFEGGGVGSRRGAVAFPSEMRRPRRSNGTPVYNSWLADTLLTSAVYSRNVVSRLQHDLRRHLSARTPPP